MKRIDLNKTREFYERVPNVWPENDKWHEYSKRQIQLFLHRLNILESQSVLNAGSGGNDYGLKCNMHHLDIAENKISHFSKYTVSSIDKIPLEDMSFDTILCVGSVINYSDAIASISEFSRLISQNGVLILEFESSWGLEHLNTRAFKKPSEIVTLRYNNEKHQQWIFSYQYIQQILESYGFKIETIYRFHILSSLVYNKRQDENFAAKFTKYDKLLRFIPRLNRHSNNIILKCRKL